LKETDHSFTLSLHEDKCEYKYCAQLDCPGQTNKMLSSLVQEGIVEVGMVCSVDDSIVPSPGRSIIFFSRFRTLENRNKNGMM
jgi:hypothetical protein